MKPRWSEIETLFFDALEVPVGERAAWLGKAAGDRPELARDVLALLEAHEASESAAFRQRVGIYCLDRRIGRGGMGDVWLASRDDGQFEQRVAIKLVRSGLGAELRSTQFRQERQLLARLNHPNIARLFDGGVSDDGRPYLVMEFIEGEPFLDYALHRALPVRNRIGLFLQLCTAVEYAHRNLIVHGDIKPANVLVSAEGVPKLLDFGIASLLNSGAEQDQMPARLLTPTYASPEQVQGLPLTTATDVYSLGMLLYVLLTGKPPYVFRGDTAGEMERVIREVEPTPPSQAVPANVAAELAGDLDAVILKALEKDPLRRYGSVEGFAADLCRYLDGRTVQARAQTLAYRASRYIRRNLVPVAAAALVALSLAVGLAAALWQAHIARLEREREARRFNDVRQLAHAFLFDFHDAIQNLPGATPARHLVVEKALQYLNSLAQESGNDPALLGELAEAYLRVGEVQGGLGYPNLGDASGALRSFKRALEIARNAVRRDPGNVQWKRYLARALIAVGDLEGTHMGPAEAVLRYREALQIFDGIQLQVAGDMGAQFEIASAWEALGDFLGNPGLVNLGRYEEAKQAYQKSLAIAESIAAAHPDNIRSRRSMGLRRMRIGDIELGLGNAEAALTLYREAVTSLQKLSARDPLNPTTRLVLALAVGDVGRALEADGQYRDALRGYRQATEMHRSLMQADPRNEMASNSYALSLQMEGDLLRKTGDAAGALASYEKALPTVRSLSAADPGNVRRRGFVGDILVAMGALAAAQRRDPDAARFYREGLLQVKLRAGRAGATAEDAYLYARQLLTCPLREFADPHQGLVYARKAVQASFESRWLYLHQLARALEANADTAGAAVVERKAIALLPPGSWQRRDLETELVKFEAGAHR